MRFLSLSLALLALVGAADARAGGYTITRLPELSGDQENHPIAIGAGGNIVGIARGNSPFHAVLWKLGSTGSYTITELPKFSGDYASYARAIGAGGNIVGATQDSNWNRHAVLWKPTSAGYTITELPVFSGVNSSYANAIGPDGNIVGETTDSSWSPHAVLWKPTSDGRYNTITKLPEFSGDRSSSGKAIGPDGNIVGLTQDSSWSSYAVLWKPTSDGSYTITKLPRDSNNYRRSPSAIGAGGNIVGFASKIRNNRGVNIAVLWKPTSTGGYSTITELPVFSGDNSSFANAIDAGGNIVGGTGQNSVHAVLWKPTSTGYSTITTLPEFVDDTAIGGAHSFANAIGVGGNIVGSAGHYEISHAVLWTPQTNHPPVAHAGVDVSQECIGLTCTVELDGSASTDQDSSAGTNDNIASYAWFEDYKKTGEKQTATGMIASVELPLGTHEITLRVTDTEGDTGIDSLIVTLDPAQLTLLSIEKAKIEFEKGKAKIRGKLALPAGLLPVDVAPRATVDLRLGDQYQVLTEALTFDVKGERLEKWEVKNVVVAHVLWDGVPTLPETVGGLEAHPSAWRAL